jgi:hypothetical protein
MYPNLFYLVNLCNFLQGSCNEAGAGVGDSLAPGAAERIGSNLENGLEF